MTDQQRMNRRHYLLLGACVAMIMAIQVLMIWLPSHRPAGSVTGMAVLCALLASMGLVVPSAMTAIVVAVLGLRVFVLDIPDLQKLLAVAATVAAAFISVRVFALVMRIYRSTEDPLPDNDWDRTPGGATRRSRIWMIAVGSVISAATVGLVASLNADDTGLGNAFVTLTAYLIAASNIVVGAVQVVRAVRRQRALAGLR